MIVRVIRDKHDDVKLFFFFFQPLCTAMHRAGFAQRNSRDWRREVLVAPFDFASYFSPFFSCPCCYLRLLTRHRIRRKCIRERRGNKHRWNNDMWAHFISFQWDANESSEVFFLSGKSRFWIIMVLRFLNVSTCAFVLRHFVWRSNCKNMD